MGKIPNQKEKKRRKRRVILAETEDIETENETEDDEEEIHHNSLPIRESPKIRRSSDKGQEKWTETGDAWSSLELTEEDSSEWEEEIPLSQLQARLREESWPEPMEIETYKTDTDSSEKKELPLSQPHSQSEEGEVDECTQELPIKLRFRGVKPQQPSIEQGRVDPWPSESS